MPCVRASERRGGPMRFDYDQRVSEAWALWDSSRRAEQPPRTLCESSFAWIQNTRVGVYARVRLGPAATVLVHSVNWDKLFILSLMAACFMSGLTVAGLIFLERAAR